MVRPLRFIGYALAGLVWLAASSGFAQNAPPDALAAARAELRQAQASFPAGHPALTPPLVRAARAHRDAGLVNEAVGLMREAVRLRESGPANAPGREFLPTNMVELGSMLNQAGRPGEALTLLRRAQPLAERGRGEGLGPNGVVTANALAQTVTALRALGRPAEAQPLVVRELAIRQRILREAEARPADRERLANALRFYAWANQRMDQRREAVQAMTRAIEVRERSGGPELIDWLIEGAALSLTIDPVSAERFARQAVAAAEARRRPNDPALAAGLQRLGEALHFRGQFADAAASFERALAMRERASGANHRSVASVLVAMGRTQVERANYAAAESGLQRAIAIFERQGGPDNPELAEALAVLGYASLRAGRPLDAEPLARRALAMRERAVGPDSGQLAGYVNDLGRVQYVLRRNQEALTLFERATRLRERAGGDSPVLSASFQLLGETQWRLGRLDEAEAALRRSLEMRTRLFGPDSLRTAQLDLPLARLQRERNQPRAAEAGLRRLAQIYEENYGADYPTLAWVHHELGLVLRDQQRRREALVALRRAVDVVERHGAAQIGAGGAEEGVDHQTFRNIIVDFVGLAEVTSRVDPEASPDALAEAFMVAQIAQVGATNAALTRMADRFAVSDPALGEKLRARTDLGGRLMTLEAQLRVALGSATPGEANRVRQQITAARRELAEIDGRIAREHPHYQRLIGDGRVSLADFQRVLGPDEAALIYVVGGRRTLLFVIRRERAALLALEAQAAWLAEEVRLLRVGLDAIGVTNVELLPRFDLARSHELYRRVFAPALPHLDGASHVFIVADQALQSIPFGILITEAPPELRPGADRLAAYRAAPWLARRHALTTLPSAMALRALRDVARPSNAREPFVGFGDPALHGAPGEVRAVSTAGLYTRGALDIAKVRALPALPDTAGELRALARSLGAGDDQVHLRDQATVARVRGAQLARYRVVAFATHGLTAGEVEGFMEPGLVLTPPDRDDPEDDGILASSEIAALRLDAEWVILSACNTASADGASGAEALSGLARAFFYAGARAILVSHWAVASDAAARLTTGLFEEAARNPALGRSEALRRSMLRLIDDTERPHLAHPLFWAPFVTVGEGGLRPG